MGFDAAAIGLADLFGFGAADAGAVAADVGLGEVAGDIGLGAGADAVAGGAAADIGAGAGAAEGAADIGAAGAAGLGAADALALGGTDLAGGGVAGALDTAGAGGLATDTAAAATAANAGTVGSTAALPGAGTVDAATAAAGDLNIDAELGASTATPVSASGPSTAATVAAANPTGPASEVAASSLTPAGALEGGGQALSGSTIADNAAAAGASAAAPSSGITDTLSSIGDKAGGILGNKAVQLGLPLGVLGYDLIKGPGPVPSNATAAINNAQVGASNVPLFNQTAATDLNLANNFQISPAQAAALSTQKQDAMNALYQQLANEGNTDPTKSSAWIEGVNKINQDALASQVQMINQLVTTAFQAAGASTQATSALDGVLMQAAQIQIQQDAAFQQSVGSALQAFGLIAALSGKFGGTNATA